MPFPVLAIFAPVVQWIFRNVVIKFVVLLAIFEAVSFLLPTLLSYLSPFLSTAGLTSAFSGLGSGVWFFVDFFQLGYGVPLMISAFVTRFLIRRLPVIG